MRKINLFKVLKKAGWSEDEMAGIVFAVDEEVKRRYQKRSMPPVEWSVEIHVYDKPGKNENS